MAYNKILTIRAPGHIKTATNYAMNKEKTMDEKQILDVISGYVINGDKTEVQGERYVTGINCFPETAAEKMKATKKLFGKSDKRLAYQIIQSFAPGEITPALAHEFSVKYAEAWLGDYEVVIGTHLDRSHIHSHIVFNSVSCVDGKKFHLSKAEFYEKLRGISDELCREYGLPVIEYVDSRNMTYDEWERRYGKGGRTLREIVHADILECIAEAKTVGEFFMLMENRGYEVDTLGKYAKVRPLEKERFFRLATLGFPDDVLRDRVAGKQLGRRKAKPLYYSRTKRRRMARKLTHIEAMYVRWLFVLGKIKAGKPRVQVPTGELRKFERYKEQLKFVSENRLFGLRKVMEYKAETVGQIKQLDEGKFRLRGAMRKNRKLFAAHKDYMRYLPIANKLVGEHRMRFEEAKEVLRKKGFEECPDKVGRKRTKLLDAAARNKEDLTRLHGRLGMLDGIIESNGHIREQIKKEMEEKEKWKEKRQDSLYRERR